MRCEVFVASLVSALLLALQPGDQFTRPLGFALSARVPLSSVQAKLGPAKLVVTGDAGEYDARVCYLMAERGPRLEFASGELGGPDNELLEFVMQADPGKLPRNCSPVSAALIRTLRLDVAGLHLGMSRAAFATIVGHTTDKNDVLESTFHYVIPKDGRDFDALIFVTGTFLKDRLVRLQINKTITS